MRIIDGKTVVYISHFGLQKVLSIKVIIKIRAYSSDVHRKYIDGKLF